MASDDDFSMSGASAVGGNDGDSFFGDNENQALNRTQAVKQGLADKPAVLHTSTNEGGKKKKIEEIYQKKTQLEHILLRPDTYSKSSPHETHHSANDIVIFISVLKTHTKDLLLIHSWIN